MKKMTAKILMAALLCAAVSCASAPKKQLADADFQKSYDYGKIDLTGAKKHTVQAGDRLVDIAERYYGGENRYYFPLIMAASSAVVKNPDLIQPGMVLTVPDLQRNLDQAEERAGIKSMLNGVADLYKKSGLYPHTQDGLRDEAKKLKN